MSPRLPGAGGGGLKHDAVLLRALKDEGKPQRVQNPRYSWRGAVSPNKPYVFNGELADENPLTPRYSTRGGSS